MAEGHGGEGFLGENLIDSAVFKGIHKRIAHRGMVHQQLPEAPLHLVQLQIIDFVDILAAVGAVIEHILEGFAGDGAVRHLVHLHKAEADALA
ncbi:hypothetical protein D3C75_1039740 [compost metagenome]